MGSKNDSEKISEKKLNISLIEHCGSRYLTIQSITSILIEEIIYKGALNNRYSLIKKLYGPLAQLDRARSYGLRG